MDLKCKCEDGEYLIDELPLYILVNKDKIRLATPKETKEIIIKIGKLKEN